MFQSYKILLFLFIVAIHLPIYPNVPRFVQQANEVLLGNNIDPIKIMPLGNSITAGSRSTESVGYRRELYLALTNDGYNIDFVGSRSTGKLNDFDKDNEGHSGWPAADDTLGETIHNHVYDWLNLNPPDIILLHIGTNDIGMSDSPEQIKNDIELILNEIDQWEENNNSEIHVVLAQITSIVPVGGTFDGLVSQLNNKISGLVESRTSNGDKISIVDVQNALDYDTDMDDDNWHPNDLGYTKIADVWYEELIRIFTDTTEAPVLEIAPSEFMTSSDSGETIISIESNNDWSITINDEWIRSSALNGLGDSTITIYFAENTDTTTRQGSISFNSDTLSRTFVLTQSRAQYYSLTANVLPNEGGIIEGEGEYLAGRPATLIAHPNLGWEFVKWSENSSDISQNTILTINDVERSYSLVAIFSEISTGSDNDLNLYKFNLSQNFPNPFNPTTTISYSIPNSDKYLNSKTTLKVFDILGKEVITLVDEQQEAGNYSTSFDASFLPSGMYFYTLRNSNYIVTKKMMLLK